MGHKAQYFELHKFLHIMRGGGGGMTFTYLLVAFLQQQQKMSLEKNVANGAEILLSMSSLYKLQRMTKKGH